MDSPLSSESLGQIGEAGSSGALTIRGHDRYDQIERLVDRPHHDVVDAEADQPELSVFSQNIALAQQIEQDRPAGNLGMTVAS